MLVATYLGFYCELESTDIIDGMHYLKYKVVTPNKIEFSGERFKPSIKAQMKNWQSPLTILELLWFITLYPNENESSLFDEYTKEQMIFAMSSKASVAHWIIENADATIRTFEPEKYLYNDETCKVCYFDREEHLMTLMYLPHRNI